MRHPNIHDTATLARYAERAGNTFFGADELRYFSSRIGAAVYASRYFITSERYRDFHGSEEPRLYTVREFKLWNDPADGRPRISIDTVGEFQGYTSRDAAHRVARELAAWAGVYAGGTAPYPTTNAVILANTSAGRIDPDARP